MANQRPILSLLTNMEHSMRARRTILEEYRSDLETARQIQHTDESRNIYVQYGGVYVLMKKGMALQSVNEKLQGLQMKYHQVNAEVEMIATKLRSYHIDLEPPKPSAVLKVPPIPGLGGRQSGSVDPDMDTVPLDGEGMVDPPIQI
mmetsp:Transcript_11244/g.22101  ORF Transcript_11244/g.22101 Transcript_11244/m.22101 type:complete len:146 (+) Transcript_11244:289-726(+)